MVSITAKNLKNSDTIPVKSRQNQSVASLSALFLQMKTQHVNLLAKSEGHTFMLITGDYFFIFCITLKVNMKYNKTGRFSSNCLCKSDISG